MDIKKKFELEYVLIQLADGETLAMDELFDYYYPRLYNFSKSFLKLEESIDDILQEVFIKIWQNRQNIHTSITFNSYIFTITRNLLLNELRSRLNNQKFKDKIGKMAIATEYSFFDQAEYRNLKEKVDQAINELPIRQKEIFILSRTEGLTHKEIAEKLVITSKTVEYHMTKANVFLNEKLKNLGLLSVLIFYLLI